MNPQTPEPLTLVLAPVFEALPLDQSMPALVVDHPAAEPVVAAVAEAVRHPALADHPGLRAGLWLYTDELDASHTESQALDTPTGSYWHAIMHRREGDFSNSQYWYRRAGDHPVLPLITNDGSAFDPCRFVDQAEQAHQDPGHAEYAKLLAMQRAEWRALFEWCASQ